MAGKSRYDSNPLELAAAVRDACIAVAKEAYEAAGISGLCAEGRWEVAIGAMQSLDVQAIIENTGRARMPGANP